jgi:branched-chain amino acid transport system permease protein
MTALYLVNGVAYGNLLFLMAAGFTIIFGVLRVINMAHGSLFLLGAHIAISVAQSGGGILLAIACAALATALLGAMAERLLLHRLQGDYLAQVLVTIGLFLIISDLSTYIWGGTPRVLTLPPALDVKVTVGPFLYPGDRIALIVIGPLIALGLWYLTERTIFGARIRAAVDDEEIAQAIGISTPLLRVMVFALGSLLAGFSGALGATFVGAKPGLDLEVILLALVVVVIGGPGSLVGAYIAAISIGVIDSVGKSLWPEASLFLLFVPMLIVLMVRPNGLLGRNFTSQGTLSERPAIAIRVPATLFDVGRRLRTTALAVPRPVYGVAALAVALCLPWLASDYALSVVSIALIWAIAAIALNIVLGYGGMPSLGHAALFGAGAYMVAFCALNNIGACASLIVACAAGAVVAAVLSAVSLQARQAQLLLVTLAFSQVIWGVIFKWRSLTGGDDGLIHAQQFEAPKALTHAAGVYVNAAVIFLAAILIYWLFVRSRFRLTLTGLRSNELRLSTFGYNVRFYRFWAFVLSGAVSGLAGGAYAIYAGFVSPDLFGVNTSAKMLLMVIVGGAGTFVGPVVGAFTLVGLEEFLSGLTARWYLILGLIYVIVALALRGGFYLAPPKSRQASGASAAAAATAS